MTVLITVPYVGCYIFNLLTHLCMVFSNAMAVRIYLKLEQNGVDDILVMHQSKRQQKRHYIDYLKQLGKVLSDDKIDAVFIIESFYGSEDEPLIYMNKNKYSKKIKKFLKKYNINTKRIDIPKTSKVIKEIEKYTDNYVLLNFNRSIDERMRDFIGTKVSKWIQKTFNG